MISFLLSLFLSISVLLLTNARPSIFEKGLTADNEHHAIDAAPSADNDPKLEYSNVFKVVGPTRERKKRQCNSNNNRMPSILMLDGQGGGRLIDPSFPVMGGSLSISNGLSPLTLGGRRGPNNYPNIITLGSGQQSQNNYPNIITLGSGQQSQNNYPNIITLGRGQQPQRVSTGKQLVFPKSATNQTSAAVNTNTVTAANKASPKSLNLNKACVANTDCAEGSTCYWGLGFGGFCVN